MYTKYVDSFRRQLNLSFRKPFLRNEVGYSTIKALYYSFTVIIIALNGGLFDILGKGQSYR